jgi:hypothetical protein
MTVGDMVLTTSFMSRTMFTSLEGFVANPAFIDARLLFGPPWFNHNASLEVELLDSDLEVRQLQRIRS